jgi:fluoride exporter
MRFLIESLTIAAGAALGANARYWIGALTKASTQSFPWPTMLINILGSALLGAFTAAALLRGWGWQWRLFFAVGLCGGFTTFSTFSYEVIDAFYERSWRVAALYALLSFVLCVAGCLAGGHFTRIALQSSGDSQPSNGNPFAR